MSTTISPLRRIAVTLAVAGGTALGTVAIAPAAFAASSVAVAPAAATTPATPAVVYDKNGNPVAAPTICTPQDLADAAQRVADATARVAPLVELAAKSHDAAGLLRAQEPQMTVRQVKVAEKVADGLDSVGDKLAAKAQAAIDKAGQLDCLALPTGARF